MQFSNALQKGEELYMYFAISYYVVNVILIWQAQEDGQKPAYYVSKAMVDLETWYSQVEHMALTLRVVAKKLRLYFQAYQVTILTNQPLKVTLHKLDLSGQMMKWAIKLNKYDIQYKSCLSFKY